MPGAETADLERVFSRIIKKLHEEEVVEVELADDLYREIPTDSWATFEKDVIVQGSLHDDLAAIELLVHDPNRPCTYVDFDRVASLLRAIRVHLITSDA
jgi:hypothetical protein